MSDTIPENTPTKQCKDCSQVFPATLEFFPPDKKRLKARCRPCDSARYKKWLAEHREERISYCKQWRTDNPKAVKDYNSQYKEAHRKPIEPNLHPGQKQCRGCLEWLPATRAYFHIARRGKNGLASQCKRCLGRGRTFGRAVTKPDRHEKQCQGCLTIFPKTPQYFHRTRNSHNDGFDSKCKTCRKELYQLNRVDIRKIRKNKRKNNVDLARAKDRTYYARNRDHKRKKSHDSYMRNRERQHAAREQYRVTHYAEHNAYMRNRNALKKSIPGSHTPQDIRELYKKQKGSCYYCRHKVAWGKHHVDHTFPISRVIGTDIPANDISYLVITCPTCNLRKSNKFPWEFPEGGRLL